jgi:dimethylhistidine N-methyltransferase
MAPFRSPRFVQSLVADAQADAADQRDSLQRGLLATPAHLSPKYFYDALGSRLFEAITELPEYYPTRTEAAIFAEHGADMARRIGTGRSLIDLGAGNCAKAAGLFPLFEPSRYVAIDISVDFLRDALRRIQCEHPQLEMTGLGMDFTNALDLPKELTGPRPLFFYPGSSIGNFSPDEARTFLAQVHRHAQGGGLLIGIDLVKPTPVLEAAYDDAIGVTAAFNLNALRHVNRLLGSNFDPADWRHRAFFNEPDSRIEMHLEARRALHVTWPAGERRFAAGERIHTENSCKYRLDDFRALLRDAGFTPHRHWTDAQDWFALVWAEA